MGEILTITELAALLKMRKGQIYEMTKERTRNGSMKAHPLPVLKINGNWGIRSKVSAIPVGKRSVLLVQRNDVQLGAECFPQANRSST